MNPSPTRATLRATAPGRSARTDRRTLSGPALRVRPLEECLGWTGSPCSWWPWPW